MKSFKLIAVSLALTSTLLLTGCTGNETEKVAPKPVVAQINEDDPNKPSLVEPVNLYFDELVKNKTTKVSVVANSLIVFRENEKTEPIEGMWAADIKKPEVLGFFEGARKEDNSYSVSPSLSPKKEGSTKATFKNAETEESFTLEVSVKDAKVVTSK